MVVSAGCFSLGMGQFDQNRRTKIVATIGPATESPERIKELVQAGATTFRLNFSHGDHSEHASRIATIRQVGWDEIKAGVGAVGAWFLLVVALGGARFFSAAGGA